MQSTRPGHICRIALLQALVSKVNNNDERNLAIAECGRSFRHDSERNNIQPQIFVDRNSVVFWSHTHFVYLADFIAVIVSPF